MCRLIFAIDDGFVVFLYFNHVVWLRDGLIVEWWGFLNGWVCLCVWEVLRFCRTSFGCKLESFFISKLSI